jgi:hypothetical protein
MRTEDAALMVALTYIVWTCCGSLFTMNTPEPAFLMLAERVSREIDASE